jgi:hypothetical protein
VPLAGNLVPGWALALLALTLLLPAALASADGIRRAVRTGAGIGWAGTWAASRALPLLAALIFFYFLSLVGLVASPTFPFDPNLFGVGAGQILVMVLVFGVATGVYYAIRGWRVPAVLPSAAAVPALGALSALAVFIAWLANPFLGLLLVPTAHVWVVSASRRGALAWPFVLGAGTLSLLPLVAALVHVSGSLGPAAPWLLMLMVSDGQFGFAMMLSLCLVGGGLLGIAAVALRGGARPPASRAGPPPGPPLKIPAESAMEPADAGRPANPVDAHPITSWRPGDDLGSDISASWTDLHHSRDDNQ